MASSGFPEVIGFPFARIDFYPDILVFSAGRGVPFGRPHWSVARDKIWKIERTQHGVRFYAEGFKDPWVAGSLFPTHFMKKLIEQGIVPEGPVIPSRWNTI
jgi:hypothetical protein